MIHQISKKGILNIPKKFIVMFDGTYDQEKSKWTKSTRGVDFLEARAVWEDPESIEGPATTKDGEERWLKVGLIEEKLWAIGFTYRPAGIRIFMARPARQDERAAYYGY